MRNYKYCCNSSFLDINTQTILHLASLINRRNKQLACNKDVAVFIQRIYFILLFTLINNDEFSIVPRLNFSYILYRSNSNRNEHYLSLSLSLLIYFKFILITGYLHVHRSCRSTAKLLFNKTRILLFGKKKSSV